MPRRLAALACALGVSACAGQTVLYGDSWGMLVHEPSPRQVIPLARRVRWIRCEDGAAFRCDADPVTARRARAGAAFVFPTPTTDTGELFARWAAHHRSSAERTRDPAASASHRRASIESFKAAARANEARRRLASVPHPGELQLADLSRPRRALASGRRLGESDAVEAAIAWALRAPGWIGRGAPQESELLLYLRERASGASERSYEASMALALGGRVVATSGRVLVARPATATPPAGFFEAQPARELTGVEEGELALLLRSLARELNAALRPL